MSQILAKPKHSFHTKLPMVTVRIPTNSNRNNNNYNSNKSYHIGVFVIPFVLFGLLPLGLNFAIAVVSEVFLFAVANKRSVLTFIGFFLSRLAIFAFLFDFKLNGELAIYRRDFSKWKLVIITTTSTLVDRPPFPLHFLLQQAFSHLSYLKKAHLNLALLHLETLASCLILWAFTASKKFSFPYSERNEK